MSRSTDAEFLEAASTGQSHIVTSVLADLSAEEKQRIMLVTTAQGHTALHAAAFGGHASVVNVLLAAGADRELRTSYGKTAHRLVDELRRERFRRYWCAQRLQRAGRSLAPLAVGSTSLARRLSAPPAFKYHFYPHRHTAFSRAPLQRGGVGRAAAVRVRRGSAVVGQGNRQGETGKSRGVVGRAL